MGLEESDGVYANGITLPETGATTVCAPFKPEGFSKHTTVPSGKFTTLPSDHGIVTACRHGVYGLAAGKGDDSTDKPSYVNVGSKLFDMPHIFK